MFSNFFGSKQKDSDQHISSPIKTVKPNNAVSPSQIEPTIELAPDVRPNHLQINSHHLKIVFIGSSAVGKTTIVERFSCDYGTEAITRKVQDGVMVTTFSIPSVTINSDLNYLCDFVNPEMLNRITTLPLITDNMTLEFWDVSFTLNAEATKNNDGDIIPPVNAVNFQPILQDVDGIIYVCSHGPPTFVRASLRHIDFAQNLFDQLLGEDNSTLTRITQGSQKQEIPRYFLIHKQDIDNTGIIIMNREQHKYVNLIPLEMIESYCKAVGMSGYRTSSAELGGGPRTSLARSIQTFITSITKRKVLATMESVTADWHLDNITNLGIKHQASAIDNVTFDETYQKAENERQNDCLLAEENITSFFW